MKFTSQGRKQLIAACCVGMSTMLPAHASATNSLASFLLGLGTTLPAQAFTTGSDFEVKHVTVDATTGALTAYGDNFTVKNGRELAATIGSELLPVTIQNTSKITATVPKGLGAGTYTIVFREVKGNSVEELARTYVTIGAAGPKGEKGDTGAQGPAGSRGEMGPAGPAGPEGAMGPIGPLGPVGPMGSQGLRGFDGAPGAQGPQGIQGLTGAQGPAGAEGPIGPMGATGAMGPAGVMGPVGPMGPMGPMGATGSAGRAGDMGPAGATGATGATGPKGDMGPAGPAGESGTAGPQGAKGDTGAQGPAGPQGPAGSASDKLLGTNIIPSSGRVGIGTTDPLADLDVRGVIRADELKGNFDQGRFGFMMLGDVQIAWGRYVSNVNGNGVTNLPAPFLDEQYSVSLTPDWIDPYRVTNIISRGRTSFIAQSFQGGTGSRSAAGGSYIAIGRWR